MRARVEWKWGTDTHNVWLYERATVAGGGGRVLRHLSGDVWEWQEIEEGSTTVVEPTFTLPPGGLQAIVAEAGEVLPPSGQMAKHLDDACTVRDRLLSMLEKQGIQ